MDSSSSLTAGLSALFGSSSAQISAADLEHERERLELNDLGAGYCPLSVRLVELACRSGWRKSDDILQMIAGRTFELAQDVANVPSASAIASLPPYAANPIVAPSQSRRPVVLVVLIGGCTLHEISCLRALGQRVNRDFVIVTTKIINGSQLLSSLASVDDVRLSPERRV